MTDKALIIFIKNPVKGKVKTRLAKDIGEENALEIYKDLLKHTRLVCEGSDADLHLFYSDEILEQDEWDNDLFIKHQQEGYDLGARMYQSIEIVQVEGYKKVVVIGSDCLELEVKHIDQAFSLLDTHQAVIGPAEDGGFYLIGLKENNANLFLGKEWSHDKVCAEMEESLKEAKWEYSLLEKLFDIDTLEDVKENHLLAPLLGGK